MKLPRLFSAVIALAFASLAAAGSLSIGDQAPDLGKDVTWIKGDPVTEFQDGKIYILDFWATWCKPCIDSIPHMNEIAEKHEDDGVTVIGVAIWPTKSMTPTAEFVEKQGDKMSYTIAADVDGATATKYMKATGSNGIPTVMIVNRQGVLAWIGHPMVGMDEALGQIIAGTYDIESAANESRRMALIAARSQPLMDKANKAYMAGDFETVVTTLEELIDLDPDGYQQFRLQIFAIILQKIKDEPRAYTYAKKMMAEHWSEDSDALGAVAWIIVDTADLENRDLQLALGAAMAANKLTGDKDPMLLDTLAAVYFHMGQFDKAVTAQRQAIANADPQTAEQLQASLDKFIAAAGGG